MDIKYSIIKKISEYFIKDKVSSQRLSPKSDSINADVYKDIDGIIESASIPSVEYNSYAYSSDINKKVDMLSYSLKSTSLSLLDVNKKYNKLLFIFNKINKRLEGLYKNLSYDLDRLLGYKCYYIDNSSNIDSNFGKIGNFITLPYLLNKAKVYSENIKLSIMSTDNIIFSNLDNVQTLLSNNNPSLKISSKNNIINFTIGASLDKLKSNALYIKLSNKADKITIYYLLDGKTIREIGYNNTNEILDNYNEIIFNKINISISIKNTNTDKPLSFKIEKFFIYSDLQFIKNGTFISKNTQLDNFSEIDSISVSYNNINNSNEVLCNQLLSINNNNNDMLIFNKINLNADISTYNYKFNNTNLFKSEDLEDIILDDITYSLLEIIDSDNKIDINCKNSIIYSCINSEYASEEDITKEQRHKAWTYQDGYYITNILNLEDNIFVDVGQKSFELNGILVSGKVEIPIGTSRIKVHSRDIDINKNPNISTIRNDQFDFIHLFSGIPEFDNDILKAKITKSFQVTKQDIIYLNDPFISLSETVTDDSSFIYELTLNRAPLSPGQYSIEPNSGIIRIFPKDNNNLITITYRKASPLNKSIGILFSNLLEYQDIDLFLKSRLQNTFSILNSGTSKKIIIPKLQHSSLFQLAYNLNSDNISASIKLMLSTKNKHLTPIIKSLSILAK